VLLWERISLNTRRSSSYTARGDASQVRDLYWTFRNFRNRVADFVRYRRVTANMDERFADATPEDLARCDGICIICREDMAPGGRNKKLPCSHVFHLHCLRFRLASPLRHFSMPWCSP
jgi:hypothetical protein